jgi:hypothetical protein
MPVVAPIPHPPRRFVVLVAGQDEATFEARTKLFGRGRIDARGESPRSSQEHAPDAAIAEPIRTPFFNSSRRVIFLTGISILTLRFKPVLYIQPEFPFYSPIPTRL